MIIKKSNAIVVCLIALWLIAWISKVDVGAIHSSEDVINTPHKVMVRIIISIFLIFHYLNKIRSKEFFEKSFLYVAFIVWNIGLMPMSANLFYSSSRLLEFSLMVATCFLIADIKYYKYEMEEMFRLVFRLFSVHLSVALILYFVSPEWGAKMAGFDKETGLMTYRFGGAFLRIDLVSAMAGCMSIYWIFSDDSSLPKAEIIFGSAISILALFLAHSRASLIAATLIILMFYFVRKNKNIIYPACVFVFLTFAVIFYWSSIINFYTRGETVENIMTGSGRTNLFIALMEGNNWVSILGGNGYLMNSSQGLYFNVKSMNVEMASPHNGYLSVLLGSGVVGLILVFVINLRIIKNLILLRKYEFYKVYDWMLPAVLYLSINTIADYGIWGVTSPALLMFLLVHFASEYLALEVRQKNENSSLCFG